MVSPVCCALFVAFLVGPLTYLSLLVWRRHKGRISFRIWALLLLIVSGILSLRTLVDLPLLGSLIRLHEQGDGPSTWLREVWHAYAWPLYLVWLVGGVAILFLHGFTRPDGKRPWRELAFMALAMAPTLLADAALESELSTSHEVLTEGTSPDGHLKVRAVVLGFGLYEGPADLWCEEGPHPLLTRRLAEATYQEYSPGAGQERIVWSKDSQVVFLLSSKGPAVGYDFSTASRLGSSEYGEMDRHGGPAVPDTLPTQD